MVKSQQKKIKDETTKITVGRDEFCSSCMEWREYNEEGKCKVCGKFIKTTIHRTQRANYDEYGTDSGFDESNDEGENNY